MSDGINNIDPELEEMYKQGNTYEEYISAFVEGFVSKLFSEGITKEVKEEDLKKYFANPDTYYKEISDILTYYYISNGDIFQLYDLVNVLPTLNYKIDVTDKSKKYEKNLAVCTNALNKVNHKESTRDILMQTISTGTTVCMWVGDKKNPYLYVFDNLKYVFPAYRLNGDWVVRVDMAWFDEMKDEERSIYFANLKPFVTESMYKKYKNNTNDPKRKYIELPQDRTSVIRTHTLKRNQRLGLAWGTSSLYDISHKKTLKNLEKNIANKIINSIALLTIGSEKNTEYANLKLNKNLKQKVFKGVKTALDKSTSNAVTVVSMPEWTNLKFGEIPNGDISLDPKKYESINDDLTSANGYSRSLTNGNGGNFASAKLNLEVLYKRIGVILEQIERLYQKLFALILPVNVSDNYNLIYDKEIPISQLDKINALQGLHSEGFAVKPIVDLLDGIDYNSYIEQSIYEIETMGLREKIIPPRLSFTTSGKDNLDTKPTNNNPENDNTIQSQTQGGNSTPRAEV